LLQSRLPRLLDELPGLAGQGRPLVLEVHEDFAADLATFAGLRSCLGELGIRLAYDDFGAGQARLATLAQVAADFVKLDRGLVQGLPHSRALRDLVQALGRICADLGSQVLAEGVESAEEAALCLELGCQLGQGYLFGRP